MGFAQSFLAGQQIRKSEEDRKFRALQMIMGRKPVTSGRAVSASRGPSRKAEDEPRVWEQQAEEEHRAEMRAQQAQMGEEQLEMARTQNRALQAAAPTDYDIQAQAATEAAGAWGQVAEIERGIPVQQAQELAGKQALDKGLREESRKKHISGYANKDPKLMQEGWKGMFPGAQFEAEFNVDPQGQTWITFPGSPEPEPYDQGMFRQFAMFAGNTGLEQQVTTPGGGEISAAVGGAGARPGKTSAGLSVKDYLAYLQKEQKGKIDMYEFARKFAEGQAETVDDFGTKTMDQAKYDDAWDKAVNLFQQTPTKAYAAGVPKPKRSISISQGKTLSKRAIDEYNDFKEKGQIVEPKLMFNKLLEEYGPRVAFGFMEGIKEDVFAEKKPTGAGGFDVRTTGEFAGSQPSPPLPPAAPLPQAPGPGGAAPGPGAEISPTPMPDMGPMQNAPRMVQLPNTGDSLQIDPYNGQVMITDSFSGEPKPVTQEHINDLILQAKAAPPEQRSYFGAIFDFIRKQRAGKTAGRSFAGAPRG